MHGLFSWRARSRLRKARSNPRQALQRSWKAIEGLLSLLRPGLQRQRPGNVVMFHQGRCGSTVLGGMLDQHPHVFWDGEIYHRSLTSPPKKPGDPLRLLTRRMARAGTAYYGFEMKPVHLKSLHLELDGFLRALETLRFTHFIVLERSNHLRRFLSGLIARQSNVFHRAPGDPISPTYVTIDVARVGHTVLPLTDFLAVYEEFNRALRAILKGKETLWLKYEEDILRDPLVAYHKALLFLNLEPVRQPEIWYGRTNPFPVQEMISNFDEVENALRGTRFEWMLYD